MKKVTSKVQAGIVLPITTMVVAGITFLLLGLLTILSFERKSSQTYADLTRCQLALESGLSVALASLAEVAGRDDSLVFRLEDPQEPTPSNSERPSGFREQFFTFGAVFQDHSWRAIPLFSGFPEVPFDSEKIDAQVLSTLLFDFTSDLVKIGSLSSYDQNIARAKWLPFSDPDAQGNTTRYAYWVEDLSGRIPGKTAGTSPRGEGKSAAEIDYATILYPDQNKPSLPSALIDLVAQLRTSASLRQLGQIEHEAIQRLEPNIHFYEIPKAAPKLIPQGFGYKDAGKPAPDLNAWIEEHDVEQIASHIERQIPDFKNRAGGFPIEEDYLKTLAASMIDYADADSDATTGVGYRGVDSYPFVNEIFDRCEWLPTSPSGEIHIRVETYIELWNLCQHEITGEVEFTNQNKQKLTVNGGGVTEFTPITFPKKTVTIPPNGFLVLRVGEHTYRFPDSGSGKKEIRLLSSNGLENNFLLKWKGRLVDTARGGLHRQLVVLRPGSEANRIRWLGSGAPANDLSLGQYGDPRISFYMNSQIPNRAYKKNSNWGGRALHADLSQNNPLREVRLEKWPDRGSNSDPGKSPNQDTERPSFSEIVDKNGVAIGGSKYPANQPLMAPARISNAGVFQSLGELGNIFDPAQWFHVEQSYALASSASGGGMTLAIGRPEFAAFEKNSWRSAQLLDLFSLGQTQAAGSAININTAPREVLRALMAGITLDDDPLANDVKMKQAQRIGDYFADFVIAHRQASPLRALSDLNQLRKNPLALRDFTDPDDAPFFGNSNYFKNVPLLTDPMNQQIEWNDAGREELFRKVMDLLGFHSKLFRIVVASEIRDKGGKLVARCAKEYHYRLEPEREAEGLIKQGGKMDFIKLYEIAR